MRPGNSIRHADVEGYRVVLDLATSSYYVLDETASAMWAELAAGAAPETAAARLESRFDVEPARLRADLADFAADCVARGFLVAAEPAQPERTADAAGRARTLQPALELRALAALLATARALRRDGFGATYERYSRLPVAPAALAPARAARAFVRAENAYVARNAPDDCLVRSLAILRFMRSVGIGAEHVIGVRRVPFAVHAWAEVARRPLLDDSPVRAGMTELARIPTETNVAPHPWRSRHA